ncbi:MAG: hypothetical protein EB141_21080 [Verrucomicrobia bacterium]|nr:hypothetical protein [Pseudomonadota bacterium]NDB78104.1 hypothetical protein [Verrucomicrobiota bacterium]
MNTEHLKQETIDFLKESASVYGNTPDAKLNALAKSSVRFAAMVFDHLIAEERAAEATVAATTAAEAAPVSIPLPTPVATPTRRTGKLRSRATQTPRIPPQDYATRATIEHWVERNIGTRTEIRSAYGRRADCFIAVALLNRWGVTANAANVSHYTGVSKHNCGAHLNDLREFGLLQRTQHKNSVTWSLTDIAKELIK